jgi:hypothetical protein
VVFVVADGEVAEGDLDQGLLFVVVELDDEGGQLEEN